MENNKVLLKIGCLDKYEFVLHFYTPSEDKYFVVEYPWEYGELCNLFNNFIQTAIRLSIDFKCDILVNMDSFFALGVGYDIKSYRKCTSKVMKIIDKSKYNCNLIAFWFNRLGVQISDGDAVTRLRMSQSGSLAQLDRASIA